MEQGAYRVFRWTILAFALVTIVRSAWVCDDAYIVFRTVQNLFEGNGPTWNVAERVQSYTNPLWMLSIASLYWITKEVYFTSLLLQIALTMCAIWIVLSRVAVTPALAAVATFALVMSKAFVDYSTSGLENPLSHVLVAAFFAVYFSREPHPRRTVLALVLLFSFVVLTRMDNALVVLPPLVCFVVARFREGEIRAVARRMVLVVLVGLAPLVAWELFSVFYYGFPFPNTAYAKMAGGIPASEYMEQGIYYFTNSLRIDPLTMTVMLAAVVVPVLERDPARIAVAAGVVLHLLYTMRIGGDFMAGRFLTTPFLSAVVLLAASKPASERLFAATAGAVVLLMSISASFPTLSSAYLERTGPIKDGNGIVDARMESYQDTGLLTSRMGDLPPRHAWKDRGLALRRGGRSVQEFGGTGMSGYYAGPEVHILDHWALSDPLLARLPYHRSSPDRSWRPGHIWRGVPGGYIESLESGENRIEDGDLASYYEKIRIITRGPLWSIRRFGVIAAMNLGLYDRFLEAYIEKVRTHRIDHDHSKYKGQL